MAACASLRHRLIVALPLAHARGARGCLGVSALPFRVNDVELLPTAAAAPARLPARRASPLPAAPPGILPNWVHRAAYPTTRTHLRFFNASWLHGIVTSSLAAGYHTLVRLF